MGNTFEEFLNRQAPVNSPINTEAKTHLETNCDKSTKEEYLLAIRK